MSARLGSDKILASYRGSLGSGYPLTLALNRDGCLNLKHATASFGDTPMSEEHAWAVIYECCKCLQRLIPKKAKTCKLYVVSSIEEIFIHKEGSVHESTFLAASGLNRRVAISEDKIIGELGLVIYAALDCNLKDEIQRQLTPGLEHLLVLMSSYVGDDSRLGAMGGGEINEDDEGIEQDHEEDELLRSGMETIRMIIDVCANHLSVGSEAEAHFKNVCRALVSESLGLASFLERTQQSDIYDKDLQELALGDWANLWKQTMHDLRQGVKLKKTSFTKTPIEFALTPYEMLVDDIRSRRYKLNKVMVDGKLPPKVKKDAHDIILDFIRSRPPLKPASERQLPPPRVNCTPQELLMQSIRSGEARESLKKTPGPPQPKNTILMESGILFMEPPIVIDDYDNDIYVPKPKTIIQSHAHNGHQQSSRLSIGVTRRRGSTNGNGVSVHRSMSLNMRRPLSMSCMGTSSSGLKRIIRPDPSFVGFDPDDESDDDDGKNSDDSISNHSGLSTPIPYQIHKTASTLNLIHSVSLSSSSVPPNSSRASTTTSPPPATIDLSKDEIVHIRSVLSRAKMEEALTTDEGLRNDLENNKICFRCTKVRFTWYFWGNTCRLCQHSFCTTCIAKVKLRADFFSNVPLLALTPTSAATKKSENLDKVRTKSLFTFSAGHSIYVPTLSERLDHSENIENNFVRKNGKFESPKKVSFSVTQSPNDDSAKSKAASKVRLRRSNTLGRVDTHARARALRRPLPESKTLPIQNFFQSSKSSSQGPKLEQVLVCLDCKEVAERITAAEEELNRVSDDDDDDGDDENISGDEEQVSQHQQQHQHQHQQQESSHARRLRITKSLVLS